MQSLVVKRLFFSTEERNKIFSSKEEKVSKEKGESKRGERKSKSGSTSTKSHMPTNVKVPRDVLDDDHSED